MHMYVLLEVECRNFNHMSHELMLELHTLNSLFTYRMNVFCVDGSSFMFVRDGKFIYLLVQPNRNIHKKCIQISFFKMWTF